MLVSHNGFAFDFPILFAEVESRESLATSTFAANNIHFSDSLPVLHMVINILVVPNKTDIITSNLDEERKGPGSPWEITCAQKTARVLLRLM